MKKENGSLDFGRERNFGMLGSIKEVKCLEVLCYKMNNKWIWGRERASLSHFNETRVEYNVVFCYTYSRRRYNKRLVENNFGARRNKKVLGQKFYEIFTSLCVCDDAEKEEAKGSIRLNLVSTFNIHPLISQQRSDHHFPLTRRVSHISHCVLCTCWFVWWTAYLMDHNSIEFSVFISLLICCHCPNQIFWLIFHTKLCEWKRLIYKVAATCSSIQVIRKGSPKN